MKLVVAGAAAGLGSLGGAAPAPATNACPDFQEVYNLVRTNLAGAKEADLNRAAVIGFLSQLPRDTSLVSVSPAAESVPEARLLGVTNVFDGAYAYLRVAWIKDGLSDQLAAALEGLQATNRLKGFVLDLRGAKGDDYAAATKTADLFLTVEQPLLSWAGATVRSTTKPKAFSFIMTILVNQQTAGAAEALAGMLRYADTALLIGASTSGQAKVYTEYPLRDGQRLRIATGLVRLGNGRALSSEGLKPDIVVPVRAEDERAYLADPFKLLATNRLDIGWFVSKDGESISRTTATNRPARHRVNEAELVRLQKEGQNPEEDTPSARPRDAEPSKPSVQDPALARALDLLKGLAVVQRIR